MRIFISAGEPSGDLHGANLIRELRRRLPDAEFVGFGGDRMAAEGCRLLYPLCRLAVMWFLRVLANFHIFLDLISKADRYFRRHRPDAVILIDYPGFNFVLARRAHFHGIPVFYFVPPQLWGWAGWRVKKMQKWVDRVLCTLPFEKDWYAERGVDAHYVGHPYWDELHGRRLDAGFVREQQGRGGQVVGLLPGSRTQELEHNFDGMVKAAEIIHARRPDVRFLVACYKEEHRALAAAKLAGAALRVELHVGRTPEIIALAHSCIAVSGSVSLELLSQGTPTVIVYQIKPFQMTLCKLFKTARYITLVNLLADRELFPEFLVDHCPAEGTAAQVLQWLTDAAAYDTRCRELAELRRRVGEPGACARAAEYVAGRLTGVTPGVELLGRVA